MPPIEDIDDRNTSNDQGGERAKISHPAQDEEDKTGIYGVADPGKNPIGYKVVNVFQSPELKYSRESND